MLLIALTALMMVSHWMVRGVEAMPSAAVFAALIAWLALIDARRAILPNAVTYALILCGLADAALSDASNLVGRSLGAAIGFAAFAVLSGAYERFRGRVGLGMGDAKFLAGVGAWLGWALLPTVVMIASLSALLWAMPRIWQNAPDSLITIRFGPFLCVGAWSGWLMVPTF